MKKIVDFLKSKISDIRLIAGIIFVGIFCCLHGFFLEFGVICDTIYSFLLVGTIVYLLIKKYTINDILNSNRIVSYVVVIVIYGIFLVISGCNGNFNFMKYYLKKINNSNYSYIQNTNIVSLGWLDGEFVYNKNNLRKYSSSSFGNIRYVYNLKNKSCQFDIFEELRTEPEDDIERFILSDPCIVHISREKKLEISFDVINYIGTIKYKLNNDLKYKTVKYQSAVSINSIFNEKYVKGMYKIKIDGLDLNTDRENTIFLIINNKKYYINFGLDNLSDIDYETLRDDYSLYESEEHEMNYNEMLTFDFAKWGEDFWGPYEEDYDDSDHDWKIDFCNKLGEKADESLLCGEWRNEPWNIEEE